jgi:hypothetical protein
MKNIAFAIALLVSACLVSCSKEYSKNDYYDLIQKRWVVEKSFMDNKPYESTKGAHITFAKDKSYLVNISGVDDRNRGKWDLKRGSDTLVVVNDVYTIKMYIQKLTDRNLVLVYNAGGHQYKDEMMAAE